jgi:2-desacetyl-2-hydroxyethyl bacteriochlorophyllide A dehydrogenase
MKAVVLQPDHQFAIEEVQKPRLATPEDVIVDVTTAAICGSDIHAKHGLIPGIPPGTIMGHEFVGIVAETGTGVKRFKPGDRIAAPAGTWCGICPACKRREVQHCVHGAVWGGGDIFGKGLAGAQTSHVRVPNADVILTPIPANVADDQAIFVGDVFSTGYHAAVEGRIETGDTVVIFGCGPIGLGALVAASLFGPRRIFAVDRMDNRLSLAEHYGARALHADRDNVLEQIREATDGNGADVAIEAVGNPAAFAQALKAVRRGGRLSVVGLFPNPVQLPLQELVYYGIQISMGLGNVSRMDRLMGLLETGRVDLTPLSTHRFPLEDALQAYDLFENHKDQCIKVLLTP